VICLDDSAVPEPIPEPSSQRLEDDDTQAMDPPHPKTPGGMEEIELSAHDDSGKEGDDEPVPSDRADSPVDNPPTPQDVPREGAGIDPDDEDDGIFDSSATTIKKAFAAHKRLEKKLKEKEAKEQAVKSSAAAKPQAKKPRTQSGKDKKTTTKPSKRDDQPVGGGASKKETSKKTTPVPRGKEAVKGSQEMKKGSHKLYITSVTLSFF
jgi:hypothetical protein